MKKHLKTGLMGLSALFLTFFLTGCDAILEGFYPEFKEGGKFGDQSLTVSISSQFSGSFAPASTEPVIVTLVPYQYYEGENKDIADWASAVKKTTTFGALSGNQFSFKVLPDKKYRLLVYVPQSGTDKPIYNLGSNTVEKAALIKVAVSATESKELWYPGELSSKTITGYIGNTSYFPTFVYYEIFGAPSSGGGGGTVVQEFWNVNGPNDFNQGSTTTMYTIQRPWSPNLKAVYEFNVDIIRSFNNTVVTGFNDLKTTPTNPSGDFFNLSIPGLQNLAADGYKMVVEVRYADNPTNPTPPKFEKFFSVFPSGGGGEAPNNTQFSVGINFASGWFFNNEVAFSIYIFDPVVGNYTFGYDSTTYGVGTLNSSGVNMGNLANAYNTMTNLMNYHSGIKDNIELWTLNNNGTPSDATDDYWSKVIDRPIFLTSSSGGVYTLSP